MAEWDGRTNRRKPDTDLFRTEVQERLDDHGGRITLLEAANEQRLGQVRLLNEKLDNNTKITEQIMNTLKPMAEAWRDQIGFKAVTASIFRITVGASALITAVGVIVGAALFLTGAFQAQQPKPAPAEAKK